MFSYFKLRKKERSQVEEPKNLEIFLKHGASEFIGTIVLSMFLAGLSIVCVSGKPLEVYLIHPIIVGFYAGFVAVGIVLIIFLRWSCDLNPAVTIYRVISGQNSYRYGIFKIVIQFIGGIIAGLIIYGIGHLSTNGIGAANHGITAFGASGKSFLVKNLGFKSTIASGSIWIFLIELVMTSILLFPIFSNSIKDKYRDLAICFIISMSVWMGILGGTAAINPARGLAQQIPGLFFGHTTGHAKSMADLGFATLAMEAGTLLSPFFLAMVQGATEQWINPLFIKSISFKNNRTNNMKNDF